MVVLAGRQLELLQDAADVLLHGSFGDPELVGNASVGASFRHQGENFALLRRQIGEWISTTSLLEQLLDERRVDDGAASLYAFECVD